MKIDYNVTGKDRKSLVNAIAAITEGKAEYLGMPTAAYKVGCFTVDRNGTLEFGNRTDSKGWYYNISAPFGCFKYYVD